MAGIPVIDIAPLFNEGLHSELGEECVRRIGDACRTAGFFYVVNHNVPATLLDQLDKASEAFFAEPPAVKAEIAMAKAGKSWRGWFPVGNEMTSGVPDQKEGVYFGAELPAADPRPMHGPNLFPTSVPELKPAVLAYMEACTSLGQVLVRAIASSLHLDAAHFGAQFEDPLTLFRIFNYPPHDPKFGPDSAGVGEHTDYGYITILQQDQSGGLQVRGKQGEWVEAPPINGALLINLGDALEHNTAGLIRATPHRVLQRVGATRGRRSFPFFFDPSFDAKMKSVWQHLTPDLQKQAAESQARNKSSGVLRWDGEQPEEFQGTYGEYLLLKVSKVFPQLAQKQNILSHTHRARSSL